MRFDRDFSLSFNATLVRLKGADIFEGSQIGIEGFNATLVRLKDYLTNACEYDLIKGFNATLVRLKGLAHLRDCDFVFKVSMPHWFD